MTGKERTTKKEWVPVKLSQVGKISDIVQWASGKVSVTRVDDGVEPYKPKGQE